MAEEYLVIDGLEFTYKGLFSFGQFLNYIKRLFKSCGYEIVEKEKSAKIKSTGKDFYIEFLAQKPKTKYEILTIILRINIQNMINTVAIVDSKTRKLNQADITVTFDARLVTDLKERWTAPWYFFLKVLFKHGLGKMGERFEDELINDTHSIFENLKSYLNLHRFVEVKTKTKEKSKKAETNKRNSA